MTPASSGESRPTAKQLGYLKALAERTGQTFTWPRTAAEASDQIRRLKATEPSSRAERAIEQLDDRAAREAVEDAAAIQRFEIVGYGSSATWSQRS